MIRFLHTTDWQIGMKIGVAHGSLRIAGRYQLDDFPVALDAAGRLGLDYFARGNW